MKRQWRPLSLFIAWIAGVVLSLGLASSFTAKEHHAEEVSFYAFAKSFPDSINHTGRDLNLLLDDISGLIAKDQETDTVDIRDVFRATISDFPYLEALSWIPISDTPGQVDKSPITVNHTHLFLDIDAAYTWPQGWNQALFIDNRLFSGLSQNAKSFTYGEITTLDQWQGVDGITYMLILQPVVHLSGESLGHGAGIIAAIVRLNGIIAEATQNAVSFTYSDLSHLFDNISIRVNSEDGKTLYRFDGKEVSQNNNAKSLLSHDLSCFDTHVQFLDNHLKSLICSFDHSVKKFAGFRKFVHNITSSILHPEEHYASLVAIITGIIISSLLVLLINRLASEKSKIAEKVDHQTSELRDVTKALRSSVDEKIASVRTLLEQKRDLQKFQAIIDQAPVSVVVTDAQGTIEYVNPFFETVSGYSREEVIGENPRILRPMGYAPLLYENLWKTISSGQAWHGTLKNRAKNGHIFWERATIAPVHNANHQIINYIAIKENIDEIRAVYEELNDKDLQFRALADNIPALMAYVGKDLRYIYANKPYEDWFGVSSQDIVGKSVESVVGEEYFKKIRPQLLTVLEGERTQFEISSPGPDGELKDRLVTLVPHMGIDNSVSGYFSLTTDITEQRRHERERLALESELNQAHKLEAIGQLAGGIAHEINTPTQFIGDNLSFLKESFDGLGDVLELVMNISETPEQVETLLPELPKLVKEADVEYLREEIPRAIDEALEGISRVSTIVMAMKGFSHKDKTEKDNADINYIVTNTVTVSRNEWKYVSDIDVVLQEDLPQVRCYSGQIGQVILNLIVNAAHAIKDKVDASGEKGTIGVRTYQEDNNVIISISDTGTGVPETIRNRIFDPFFTTKEIGKGSGQGLALAKDFIERKHEGRL